MCEKTLFTVFVLLAMLTACSQPKGLERVQQYQEDFDVIATFMKQHRYVPVVNLPPGQQALTNLKENVDFKIFAKRRGMNSRPVIISVIIRPNGTLDFAGNPTEIRAIASSLEHEIGEARKSRPPKAKAPEAAPAVTNKSAPRS